MTGASKENGDPGVRHPIDEVEPFDLGRDPIGLCRGLVEHEGFHRAGVRCRLDRTGPSRQLRSGGQRQRICVARALALNPKLIIADEPTSALDADTRQAFVRLLFAQCSEAGSSLLFVSHDASLEHLFDRSLSIERLNQAPSQEVR